MKISIFGATGETGRRFCRRALDAGHAVRPFSNTRQEIPGVPELRATPTKLDDSMALDAALQDADVLVSAIGGESSSRSDGLQALIEAAQRQGVERIIAIGGAGIVPLSGGERLLNDIPQFPDFLVPISNAHLAGYEHLKASQLRWTMICPGQMHAGDSSGEYQARGEALVDGKTDVLYDDVAHLILRCLGEELYVGERVSVGNQEI